MATDELCCFVLVSESRSEKISGPKLAKLRARLSLTQRELGEKLGVTETRIRHIERKETTGVFAPTFRRLAEAAGMTPGELRKMIGWIDGFSGPGVFPSNVDPYSEQPLLAEIPFFEAALAAGNWTDVSEIGVVMNARQIEQGLFRVRIRGDSMQPRYVDGEVIEFKVVRVDREGIVIGGDYYIQHVDGQATFKRLEQATEETLILRALNKKKYPGPMQVERMLITRMALAVNKVIFLNEER